MKRRRFVAATGAAALAPGVRAAAASEEDRINEDAMNALWWGDFDELERQHTLYQQPGQRTAAGRSKLVLFRQGLARVKKGPENARNAFFVEMEALTLQWAQRHPDSPFARVLHASTLLAHGWSYRGNGFANTVPPDVWRDFAGYTAQCIDELAAHQAVVMRTSSAHVLLLDAGLAAGWKFDAMWAVAQAGLALNLDDEGLYRSLLRAALPRSGGSAAAIDRVIVEIAKRTAAMHGDIFYSRMYAWAADWEFEHRLFSDSRVDWPRMKAGYEQLIARYPAAINLNGFAQFACLARDKPTLLDLLERIGPDVTLDHWGSNAGRMFETCKRWASEQ